MSKTTPKAPEAPEVRAICPTCAHETLQYRGPRTRLCMRGHVVRWSYTEGAWVTWPGNVVDDAWRKEVDDANER
jgi:hypothetical protein